MLIKMEFSSIVLLAIEIITLSVQESRSAERSSSQAAIESTKGYAHSLTNSQTCINVSPDILSEIQKYKSTVKKIGDFILNGPYKGMAYENVTDFVDTFGARLTGSESLERAIDELLKLMVRNGLEDVHSEDVTAPKWVRGQESLSMSKPYSKQMQVLGHFATVETSSKGLTAEVVVVKSFDELYGNVDNIQSRAKGKILVFNQPIGDIVSSMKYRQRGAIEGSKVGAAAVLVKSHATFSLNTPHTGEVHYDSENTPIPSAEISVEDAELLYRLHKKGQKITLTLTLRSERFGNITTRNSIGDYLGISLPKEYVLVSGHVDSVDIGQGAVDDGYGVILSLMVSEVLANLKLTPKRTIRNILWSASETGENPMGAHQYVLKHFEDFQRYTMLFEADSGIFDVKGLYFNGCPEAVCIVSEILKLLEPHIIDKTRVSSFPEVKADIVELMKASGLPGAMLDADVNKYYWYQHSGADTVTALNSKDLDVCLALMTSVSYVLADLSVMLPKTTMTTGETRSRKKASKGTPLGLDLGPKSVPRTSSRQLFPGKR